MNPGDLRYQITIQQKTTVQNSFGEGTDTWTTVATVFAAVDPLRGQEYLEARRLQADIDVRFRIRYRAGLTPAMRVLHDGRYFNIESVIHVKELRREIQLMCRELINDG
jgi:SPP1 family predicted phage head-tail adaptor